MKLAPFCCCALVLGMGAGCVRSHRTPSTVHVASTPAVVVTPPVTVTAPVPAVVVPPATSDRAAARVYSSPPVVVTLPSSVPPGVSAADLALADSISQFLKSNTSLADATRNVEVTVEEGVVTLRGAVPTDHDRDEIVHRVSRMRGVQSVRDHLGVELR